MSSLTHYQLLNCDIDDDQIMEEDYKKQKNDYLHVSSSAPTILGTDLICESRR